MGAAIPQPPIPIGCDILQCRRPFIWHLPAMPEMNYPIVKEQLEMRVNCPRYRRQLTPSLLVRAANPRHAGGDGGKDYHSSAARKGVAAAACPGAARVDYSEIKNARLNLASIAPDCRTCPGAPPISRCDPYPFLVESWDTQFRTTGRADRRHCRAPRTGARIRGAGTDAIPGPAKPLLIPISSRRRSPR
jgi:hypothetical protein